MRHFVAQYVEFFAVVPPPSAVCCLLRRCCWDVYLINQSKILTNCHKATHGQGEADPSTATQWAQQTLRHEVTQAGLVASFSFHFQHTLRLLPARVYRVGGFGSGSVVICDLCVCVCLTCTRVCWCRRIFTYIHTYVHTTHSTTAEESAGAERKSRYKRCRRRGAFFSTVMTR